MVNKWGKNKGDWKLSPKQRLEKEEAIRKANEVRRVQQEENQAMRFAREASDTINNLVRQYGGLDKVFIGSYYRNGMGSHFELLSVEGQPAPRFLTEEEKRGEFDWMWLPGWPKGRIGDEYLGHQDPTIYEEVFPIWTGINDPIRLQDPFSGEFFVIQQQCKMRLTRVPSGLQWVAQSEDFYDASRPCRVRWEDQWILMPAWHFVRAVPAIQLIPNPVVDPIAGFENDGSAPQAIQNNGVEAAPVVPAQPQDAQDPFQPIQEFGYSDEEMNRMVEEMGIDTDWQNINFESAAPGSVCYTGRSHGIGDMDMMEIKGAWTE